MVKVTLQPLARATTMMRGITRSILAFPDFSLELMAFE
jgi:hypothetical protein